MIYYSDKRCSNTYNSNKTAIGVVIKNNALIMSIDIVSISWASGYIDTALNNMSSPNAQADMNGKNNTSIIVSDYPNDTANNNAAVYCNKHTIAGTSFEQWYLPSLGELTSLKMKFLTLGCVLRPRATTMILNLCTLMMVPSVGLIKMILARWLASLIYHLLKW